MPTNLERFKADLSKLIDLGNEMYADFCLHGGNDEDVPDDEITLEQQYQRWYTEALSVVKQLIPDRFQEFVVLYHPDSRRKQIDTGTYRIQDWLLGVREPAAYGPGNFDTFTVICNLFSTQLGILKSAKSRFESSLFDIAQVVRAELFDSELDAARELVKNGFLRGAGAIAGVVLEKHLAQVCANHNVAIRVKDPTIGKFNDALKEAMILDVPGWRQIQRLGDIRNLCDHNKERKPTLEEVNELIDGADKLCKTLF
jgi:hypothetical protein